ncbi:MAG: hypothetical protein ACREH6_00535 [Geminicoccaceae bacterium]
MRALRPPPLVPALLAGILLIGCAARPNVDATSEGDALGARRALQARTSKGPVFAVIEGNPFNMLETQRDALVTEAMAAGVSGMGVRFTSVPAGAAARDPHLVVVLDPAGDPSGGKLCQAPGEVPTGPRDETLHLAAAFCQGGQALRVVSAEDTVAGPADRRFKRLLWRTSDALFPDDYADTYGFDLIPGIDLGIGGSFGF